MFSFEIFLVYVISGLIAQLWLRPGNFWFVAILLATFNMFEYGHIGWSLFIIFEVWLGALIGAIYQANTN